jgi:hypothetical protein
MEFTTSMYVLKQHQAAADTHIYGGAAECRSFTKFTTIEEEIVPLTNFCLTPNLILNEGGKLAEGMSHSIFRFPLRHPIESWEIE